MESLVKCILRSNKKRFVSLKKKSLHHYCSKQGFVSDANVPIVCLPNETVVKLKKRSQPGYGDTMNVKKSVILAFLVAVGILLQLLESFVGIFMIVPGYKIGLANIAGLFALYIYDEKIIGLCFFTSHFFYQV